VLLRNWSAAEKISCPWRDWKAFRNRKFADKVLENAHDGDLVWVHDYQLMLLPGTAEDCGAESANWFFPAHAVSFAIDFAIQGF